jgi:hypothetical protein
LSNIFNHTEISTVYRVLDKFKEFIDVHWYAEDIISNNIPELKFKEIDHETRNARENHAMDLFMKNGITYLELRDSLNKEALTPEKEKELYWNKFGKEQALIVAVDESYTNPQGDNSVSEKNNPQNQYGKRGSAKEERDFLKDSALSRNKEINPILKWHKSLEKGLQEEKTKLKTTDMKIEFAYGSAKTEMVALLRRIILKATQDPRLIIGLTATCTKSCEKQINRLKEKVRTKLSQSDLEPTVVMASLEFMTRFIFDTQVAYTKNLVLFRVLKSQGIPAEIIPDSAEPCEICKSKLTLVAHNDTLGEEDLPPYHLNCTCRVARARK